MFAIINLRIEVDIHDKERKHKKQMCIRDSGKGTTDMDLSKEELLAIKNLYLNSNDKDKMR